MSAESEACEAARRFREEWHLGVQPLGDLVTLLEMMPRVDVVIDPAVDAGGHGMTTTDPETGVTIIMARTTPHPMRLRSTLAHELCHYVLKDEAPADGEWQDRSPVEQRADNFARHLLLPIAGLTEHLGVPSTSRPITAETLSSICQTFQVSSPMAAIQLCNSGHITASQKDEWMSAAFSTPRLAAKFGWGPVYNALREQSLKGRPPQSLLARAVKGYEEGVVSVERLATLWGVSPEEMTRIMDEAEIWVREVEPEPEAELEPIDAAGFLSQLDDLFADDDNEGRGGQ